MNRLNAHIMAVGVIIVSQLGVLTAVLDVRLGEHPLGWVAAAQLVCFLLAFAVGLTAPRRQPTPTTSRVEESGGESVSAPRLARVAAG
ncbi:MAG: hypothetical protein NVSMB32_02410 [Actinomycetota bacterium]